MQQADMEAIYAKTPIRDIPWDVAAPPEALVQLVEGGGNPCGKAVDFGCGGGNYSIYLARQGFEVTGIDISPTAIGVAREGLHRGSMGQRKAVFSPFRESERLPKKR